MNQMGTVEDNAKENVDGEKTLFSSFRPLPLLGGGSTVAMIQKKNKTLQMSLLA